MKHGRRLCNAMLLTLAYAPLWRAHAQDASPREVVRGTIVSVDGQRLVLKTADGATSTLHLASDTRLVGLSRASLDSIVPGSFVGTAATPDANGNLVAQEVHIFSESMRGTGEGHRPYSRAPQGTMTNATVAQVSPMSGQSMRQGTMTNATVSSSIATGSARRLTLTYKQGDKQGTQEVVVPPDAPVVLMEPGQRSLLVPGAHVVAFAARQPDGTLAARSVSVGKDGLMPPM